MQYFETHIISEILVKAKAKVKWFICSYITTDLEVLATFFWEDCNFVVLLAPILDYEHYYK